MKRPKNQKKPQPTEREITRLALDWLQNLCCVDMHRRNTGFEKKEHKGKERVIRYGTPGAADWWYVGPNGLHVDLEIKRPGAWPTIHQRVWMLRINAQGGAAYWIDRLEILIRVHESLAKGFRICMCEDGSYDITDEPETARAEACRALTDLWSRSLIPRTQGKAVQRIIAR